MSPKIFPSKWGFVPLIPIILITLQLLSVQKVHAQETIGGVETECVFQTMNPTGNSILEITQARNQGGSNLVWDNKFPGLHKWSSGEWAGIDVGEKVRVPFKKGGVVIYSPSTFLQSDGGHMVLVRGKGKCSDFVAGFIHMDYLPASVYPVGTEVSADELLGIPGCSGFDRYCLDGIDEGNADEAEYIFKHVHIHNMYCGQGNIDFGDGSTVDRVSIKALGLNCQAIHPARLEDSSLHKEEIVLASASVNTDLEGGGQDLSAIAAEEASITEVSIPEVKNESRIGTPENPVWGTKGDSSIRLPSELFYIFSFIMVVWGILLHKGRVDKRMTPVPLAAFLVITLFFGVFSLVSNISEPKIAQAAEAPTPTPLVEIQPALVSTEEPVEEQDTNDCIISENFPPEVRQWCDQITKHSKKNNFDPDLIAAIIWQESGGNPIAFSSSGAVGLMQVMPHDGIAASFQCINGPCFTNRPSISELQRPSFNIKYGTGMLAGLKQKYGSIREALKFYGPMNVGYYYADKVLGIYNNNKKQ
jgi:hypothetical protein